VRRAQKPAKRGQFGGTRGITKRQWRSLPREKKLLAVVYMLLRYSVIAVMVAQAFNGNLESVFLCILTLFLFLIPSFIERRFRIDVPDTLEVVILLFIYAAEILGEIRSYYITFPYWDDMLHTINGFLCAAIGFSLVDVLNRNSKVTSFSLSPAYMALVAFCFSMTVGVLWEFFECFIDCFLHMDMQKDTIINTIHTVRLDPTGTNRVISIQDIADVVVIHTDGSEQVLGLGGYLDIGLLDTMRDLFVNFIGAVTFSMIGYFYVKRKGKGAFARRFIPTLLPPEDPPARF